MGIPCPACGSTRTWRQGRSSGRQRIYCNDCRRRLIAAGERVMPIGTHDSTRPPKSGGVITLEKIKNRFDISSAIMRELEKVEKGTLISEAELCQRAAGYDKNRFRRCVENGEELFRMRRVKLKLDEGDPKWFWGSVEDIEAATKMRDL